MNKRVIIKALVLAFFLSLTAMQADALDYPHNGTSNINCEDCHYVWGSEPSLLLQGLSFGLNIDDTQYNALCWSCHDNVTATQVYTHSSLQTVNGYGNWTTECKTCHEPHGNYQFRTYGSASYIDQGTVSSVTATTLTETGAGWTNDQFTDLILIPNTAWDYNNYKITGNTSDTITVLGTIDLTYANPGDTFAIVYGKLIKDTLATPNSGDKSVKFFNATGANSFADGDATYDGVCEACHTQTTYHRNDATGDHTHNAGTKCANCHDHTKGFGVACDSCHGNPPTVDAASGGPDGLANNPGATGSLTAGAHDTHVTTKGVACTECHYDSVGSGAEHNNSLTITMGFSSFGGTQQGGSYDGQAGVNYNATSTTPVTSVSNTGNKTCSNIYCHGDYDGSGLNASPVWDNPASGACSTCHAASNSSDSQPASGSHERHADSDNTLNALGMATYNREYSCTLCHKDIVSGSGPSSYTIADENLHVSGYVDWKFDTSDSRLAIGSPDYSVGTATAVPSDGTTPRVYGSCSTVYCHSNVQPDGGVGAPDSYDNPAWGGSATCATNSCHAPTDVTYQHGTTLTTGSHSEHMAFEFATSSDTTKCTICHKWNSGAAFDDCSQCHSTSEKTYHVNGAVNVMFDTSFVGGSGAYAGTPAPGDGYSTCSSIYCHSNAQPDGGVGAPDSYATPTWGNAASAACGTCHEVSVGSLTSGSHDEHLNASSVNGCGDCHTGAANDGSAYNDLDYHVNKLIDVTNSYTAGGTPGNGYGYCSTALCHEDGTTLMVDSPVWGSGPSACTVCHDEVPATGSHDKHVNTTTYTKAVCGDCHDNAVRGTTAPTQHLDDDLDVYDSAAGDLGYPQNVTKGGVPYDSCSTAYCHSSGQSADGTGTTPYTQATVTWGSSVSCGDCHETTTGTTYGEVDTGSHTKHLEQVSSGLVNGCGDCHAGAADNGTAYDSTNHVNRSIDVNAAVTYSLAGAPGNNYGTCSTASCHGSGTPTWGSTVSCSDCHVGTGDVDDYTFNNATTARLDSAEWTTQGHGKAGAPLPLDCAYCHDSGVAHDTATNPFRLANYNAGGNGWNDICYVCHKTGSAGYDPGSGSKTSSVKIDKYHQMTAHSQSGKNGGKFCWDCHDPHGDSNIKMIQARPAKTTDGTYGIPTATPGIDVVFTNNTIGTGAGGFARTGGTFEQGICNACHTASASNPKMQHYTSTSSDSHNSGQVCTICHSHSGDTTVDGNAFEGAGDCNGCHAYPPAIGDGKLYRTAEQEGKGAHTQHVNHLVLLWGGTLNAGTDQFGSGASWTNVCGVCHNGAAHDTVEAIPGNGRTIAFPAAYQFGPGAPTYNGVVGTSSGTTAKTCSNVSCHFNNSPTWQDPVTAGN
jgi:predicted CxxxxCH...CXXCH cytochrome family protein